MVVENAFLVWIATNWGYVALVIFILVLNGDKVAARVATFVPPFATWLDARHRRQEAVRKAECEEREVLITGRLNQEAAAQAQDARMQERLVSILEQALTRMWEGQDKLGSRIETLVYAVNRNNDLLTGLNMTISKLADAVNHTGKRGGRVDGG